MKDTVDNTSVTKFNLQLTLLVLLSWQSVELGMSIVLLGSTTHGKRKSPWLVNLHQNSGTINTS